MASKKYVSMPDVSHVEDLVCKTFANVDFREGDVFFASGVIVDDILDHHRIGCIGLCVGTVVIEPDDHMIFNELNKISLFNLGKEVEISYVLFDTETKKYSTEGKHYVTRKKSHIGI